MDDIEVTLKSLTYDDVKTTSPNKIKFSEMSSKAIKKYYKLQKKLLQSESKLVNIELSKTEDKKVIGTKREIRKLTRATLKYESLKDKLNLLINANYESKYTVKARAIKLKEMMFENFKFNGKKYTLLPNAKDEIFNDNIIVKDSNDNEKQSNITNENIGKELEKFKNPANNEKTASPITEGGNIETATENIGKTKDNIIQDLPINSKEESVFYTPGMTDKEIEEARNNIGEYHPYKEKNSQDEAKNIVNNNNQQSKEFNENTSLTVVDKKESLLDYIMNKDNDLAKENTEKEKFSQPNGTVVEISADGKSKVYDFSNAETPNKNFKTTDLNISDLNNYKQELIKLKEARQKAQEEAIAAKKASETARAMALKAQEEYQRKISEEQKEIERINAQARKDTKSAEMAEDYTKSIQDMLNQLNSDTNDTKIENTKEGNSK